MQDLRIIAKLLTRPLARERFQATCIPAHMTVECEMLNTWNIKLKSLRWEVVVEFSKQAAGGNRHMFRRPS